MSFRRDRSFAGLISVLSLALWFVPSAALAAEGEITDEERRHWAFRPVVRPDVPGAAGSVRTPIDAFVSARLEAAGLGFSPEADRRTLIRRLVLDLTGLPPTRDEVEAFVADGSPDAYERLVERVLASPHYGERWGRQWLDLVRFAETAGYKSDEHRPLAYRYRDYVIRSYNANLPYDRFVREQIAGDEVAPGDEAALVATGYLRLWPDESNASDVEKARQDALNDITGNVGSVFLGLTVACAQCHDHKFDPILQADFYELQAYFAGLLPEDRLPIASGEELRSYGARLVLWEAEADPLRKELFEIELPVRQKVGHGKRLKFPAGVLEAIDTRPEERTTRQRQIAFWAEKQIDKRPKEADFEKLLGEVPRARRKELIARLTELERTKPASLEAVDVMAVTDGAAGPADAYVLLTGAPDSGLDEVRPNGLDVLAPISQAAEAEAVARPGSSGRRAALASWLTDPNNPLPARVMVNRIWQGHFGRGLVATANDFGVQTPPPSHPELLDWLASEFVASGWDVKHLHRLIVLSTIYRQEGAVAVAGEAGSRVAGRRSVDPDNALFWHYPRHRLDADAIRDSLLAVSGRLGEGMYGPGVRPALPSGFVTGEEWKASESERDRNRRSVYVYAKRNLPHPFLAAFDQPDSFESCACRVTTTTATQALTLLNGEETLAAAENLAARLAAEGESLDPARFVDRAFETVVGRPPGEEERVASVAFFHEQEDRARRSGAGDPRKAAGADLCHALMNANEFLYLE